MFSVMKKLFFLPLFLLFFCGSAFAQDNAGGSFVGKWSGEFTGPDGKPVPYTMTITDAGYEFDFGNDGRLDIQGAYVVKDGQVTVWDTMGENICPTEQKGVYTYVFDGNDRVTFTKVSDECPGRGAEPLRLKRM